MGAKPDFRIDDSGELIADWDDTSVNAQHLNDVHALFNNRLQPVNAANEYLIHCKAVNKEKDTETKAKGLLHFFDFLERSGLDWSVMPRAQYQRPTYRFRDYLQKLHDTIDPSTNKRMLSGNTIKAYRSAVVGFYSYWLSRGFEFNRPPFEYHTVRVDNSGMLGHISKVFHVRTTDLKLNVHDSRSTNLSPSRLHPLSREELDALNDVLTNRKVIRTTNGEETLVKLSIETKLSVLMAMMVGLRRSEILTFPSHLIVMPKPEQKKIDVTIGPVVNCDTKNGKTRTVEIPSNLMLLLYKYKNSANYKRRQSTFLKKHSSSTLQYANPPIILNSNGDYYSPNSLNARWGEIRATIQKKLPSFFHKFHNLRSTYATYLAKALLSLVDPDTKKPLLSRDEVEARVQERLGHSNPDTTRFYIKFLDSQNGSVAHMYHELALERIFEDDPSVKVLDEVMQLREADE
ncbi:tyrosine-type recombinase/integrase [Alteromonas macleodii]|uniref:tyrosine-type recombinase/integrase n=1 Tax=Alteromonas macleodii TaxID=28108 RepID=UPI003D013895